MRVQHTLSRSLGLAAAATSAVAFVAAVPAVASATTSPSATVAYDVLTIRGTHAADDFVIDFGDPALVTIDFQDGSEPRAFERSSFHSVAVRLGAGDDQFHTFRGGTPLLDVPMSIRAGWGDDQIVGGAGDDTISGGSGRDQLLGGAGSDFMVGNSGADFVNGGIGTDTELLGSGDDVAGWDPGEGNDVVLGQSGRDTLVFNGANGDEQMRLFREGDGAVFFRTQGNIRMDLDSVEKVRVASFGGVDTVTVEDLAGSGVTTAEVDLGAVGGGADARTDTVVVNGSDRREYISVAARDGAITVAGLAARTVVTGAEPTDNLQVNALGGFDRINVGNGVTDLITLAFDLGGDQL
jgi:hypothetical protein